MSSGNFGSKSTEPGHEQHIGRGGGASDGVGGAEQGNNMSFPQLPLPLPLPNSNWDIPNNFIFPAPIYHSSLSHTSQMTADSNHWWDDAPMPPSEVVEPSVRAPCVRRGSPRNDTSRQQASQRESESPPGNDSMGPQQSDIRNMERLNINSTPVREVVVQETNCIIVQAGVDAELTKEDEFSKQADYWCRVTLNEKKEAVDEPFFAQKDTFVIESISQEGDDPYRMSLLNRTKSKIAKNTSIRESLKEGICVTNKGGEVWLNILTDTIIFVHCPFYNYSNSLDANHVLRFQYHDNDEHTERMPIKIFDKDRFEEAIAEAIKYPSPGAMQLLESFCQTKISVSKGFGKSYQARDIFDMRCWMTIVFPEPYSTYDEIHRGVTESPDEINSRS